jgi:hypothetical protein
MYGLQNEWNTRWRRFGPIPAGATETFACFGSSLLGYEALYTNFAVMAPANTNTDKMIQL